MKDDRVYRLHMRDALSQLYTYAADGKEHFLADRKTRDAVIRNLQVLGEAVKHLSAATRAAYPNVSERSVEVDRRHPGQDRPQKYSGIDHPLIRDVPESGIPRLGAAIDGILDDLG